LYPDAPLWGEEKRITLNRYQEGGEAVILREPERLAIGRLWNRKLEQDARNLPRPERHRNLDPVSAEVVAALASGLDAKWLLEVGGSSGISTIALAAAARATEGKLTSIEIEPIRQAEARQIIDSLGLGEYVDFLLGDAADLLPALGKISFALIDCEKEDYIHFFDLLTLGPGSVVVADNILSHDLTDYVNHVRSQPGVESMTLPIGKGLEITRIR
jgi:predicted O-methyltransferase YrrM